jgi:hypothetical protein
MSQYEDPNVPPETDQEYNVDLMHATIASSGIIPPDVGQCGLHSSTTYGNCVVPCGCAGPTLAPPSWAKARFRVRYKCCFVNSWGSWQEVGTSTSYTAPYAVFDYQVEVRALNSTGTAYQWYAWTSGNKNGSTKTVSWQSAKYAAQLTHAGVFLNACNNGLGTPLPSCVDARDYSTSLSATFTGLSPKERYDLFVNMKDSQNTGTVRRFHTALNLGPTGTCVCP